MAKTVGLIIVVLSIAALVMTAPNPAVANEPAKTDIKSGKVDNDGFKPQGLTLMSASTELSTTDDYKGKGPESEKAAPTDLKPSKN